MSLGFIVWFIICMIALLSWGIVAVLAVRNTQLTGKLTLEEVLAPLLLSVLFSWLTYLTFPFEVITK